VDYHVTTPKVAEAAGGSFDLDAAANAALAEAIGRPFRFTYKNVNYELPNQKLWPVGAMDALAQDGDIGRFLGEIGAKDRIFEKLTEAGLVLGELELLMEAASNDAGLGGLPNSSASPKHGSTPR
jgi:hypothetical protein